MLLRRKRLTRHDSIPVSSFSMPFYCSVKDLRCRTNSPARRKNGWNRKNIRKRTLRHMFRLLKNERRKQKMQRQIRKIRLYC